MRNSERIIDSLDEYSPRWSQPEFFDLTNEDDQVRLEAAANEGRITSKLNSIKTIAENLFEMEYPELAKDPREKEEYLHDDPRFRGYEYGTWVLYPWLKQLVRFPEERDYRKLRTYRFKDLVTDKEQKRLDMARIAVMGMSVGSNIAVGLVRNAVCGSIIIGDLASPNVSGIGRSQIYMNDLCSSKVDATAKKISLIDPFTEQIHLRDGINEDNVKDLQALKPSIVVDEVDDMQTSVLLRMFAADNRLPYVTVSDVDRRAVLELQRHDLGRRSLFAGMVSDREAQILSEGRMTEDEQAGVFARSVGYHRMTPRLIESCLRVGEDLSGIPQLGSTALAAAGIAVETCRNITLNRHSRSGISSTRLDRFAPNPTPRQWLGAAGGLLRRFFSGPSS